MTTMLLAQDFPPMGGGIARLHAELARRFPSGELIVSTPAGGAAVLVAISTWTRDLTLSVLGELGLDAHSQRLRVVNMGTDPTQFRPGVETAALRKRADLPDGGTRWLVTVARLEQIKGIDTVIQALPAILERAPGVGLGNDGRRPARARRGQP